MPLAPDTCCKGLSPVRGLRPVPPLVGGGPVVGCKGLSPVRGLRPHPPSELPPGVHGRCKGLSPVRGLRLQQTEVSSVANSVGCKGLSPVRGLRPSSAHLEPELSSFLRCKGLSPVRGLRRHHREAALHQLPLQLQWIEPLKGIATFLITSQSFG